MTDLQIEDLNPILTQIFRRVRRRRSRFLREAEKRHEQFLRDLIVFLSAPAERDRTKD